MSSAFRPDLYPYTGQEAVPALRRVDVSALQRVGQDKSVESAWDRFGYWLIEPGPLGVQRKWFVYGGLMALATALAYHQRSWPFSGRRR